MAPLAPFLDGPDIININATQKQRNNKRYVDLAAY